MDATHELLVEENRRIRLLKFAVELAVQSLMTTPLSLPEAERLIHGTRNLSSKLFPGKEHVFDLIYLPRFRRAMHEAGLLKHRVLRPVENSGAGE
ncbi:MAG: hypothetical protein HY914_05305 [Desulfomonile tiedjei]|nr:hypothetical protein [Desulfomonile tiedjei]